MGWGFRRSKSLGLFRLNLSKSGFGFSFGVPGARIGVDAKGKRYFRGGIPGTGLFYRSTLPDGGPRPPGTQARTGAWPLVGGLVLVIAAAIVYYTASAQATPPAPAAAPAPQPIVAVPANTPVQHVAQKHRRKHASRRVQLAHAAGQKSHAAASSSR